MKKLTANQLNTIKGQNIKLDIKLFLLNQLFIECQSKYLAIGEVTLLDIATHILYTVDSMAKHREWQKDELAKEGKDYLYAYNNAITQMILDTELLFEDYLKQYIFSTKLAEAS